MAGIYPGKEMCMTDIKTRDVVKGTIKTLDRAAITSERMKSAYTGIKGKGEQGYDAEERSPTEYASGRMCHAIGSLRREGIHQYNSKGQKSIQITRKNIADLKAKRAKKAAEQKKAQETAEQVSPQPYPGTESRPAVPDMPAKNETPQTGASQLIKTRQQERKILKTSTRAENSIKSTAKGTVKTAEKGVKTARTTAKTAIKTNPETAQAAQKTVQASAQATQKAIQTAKNTAKATAETTKATGKAVISSIKSIIEGTKALISALVAGGWIAVTVILIIVLFGCAVSLFGGGSHSNAYTPVSEEVQAYTPLIQKYAKKHGIPEYVELIKAVMMQESGGRGSDPMQAAECGYNIKYPNTPNGIPDPEYSVDVGIQNLAACLNAAGVKNPLDMENIKLALQGYNFGNGYITWAKANYGGYSYANALEFSVMQAEKHGWSGYGDTQYVAHVLRYYPYGRAFTGGGNQAIVEVALTQLGNEGGQPYWSWYGFGGRVEWCACFVSWCADQCGYLENGIIPKFSLCSDGVNWFRGNGQWQGRNYEPAAGDIIFFDWGGDGTIDHVGIVEKCENGMVYTIEGNSGDVCRQQCYPVGSGSIYGYGVAVY